MSPAIERPDPPYMQVASQIRQRIIGGAFADGEAIPSARQIARDWNVSIATATKVLSVLQADGLVRAIPGIGTVVVSQDKLRAATNDRLVLTRRSGRIYPPEEHAKIHSAELVRSSSSVAEALAIKAGTQAIRRLRVRYRGDEPVSMSTSWFSKKLAEVAPKLLETERIRQGTMQYIEECTGQAIAHGRDQLAAAGATEEAASMLRIPLGSPVLLSHHWVYSTAGNVIEYGESAALAERWVSYEYDAREPAKT